MGTDAHRISIEPDRFAAVHISQGFRVGDLIFVSGQAAVNEHGDVVGIGTARVAGGVQIGDTRYGRGRRIDRDRQHG